MPLFLHRNWVIGLFNLDVVFPYQGLRHQRASPHPVSGLGVGASPPCMLVENITWSFLQLIEIRNQPLTSQHVALAYPTAFSFTVLTLHSAPAL